LLATGFEDREHLFFLVFGFPILGLCGPDRLLSVDSADS